jgi:hypothetical protein
MKSVSCLSLACLFLLAPAMPAQDKLPESPYYPLRVGTVWHYRAGDSKFSLRVARHEKVGDVWCARVELVLDGKVTSSEDVAVTVDQARRPDGVSRYRFEGKEARPPICFFKLPPGKEKTWKVESKLAGPRDGEQTLKGSFKAGREEVTVPAGTYKAVTVTGQDLEADGTKLSVTYYFAQDVGMVKQVIETAGQKLSIVLETFVPPQS